MEAIPANHARCGVVRGRSADKARHDRMVALVEPMLELNKKKPGVEAAFRPANSEKTRPARLKPASAWELDRVEREIASTDEAIDNLVYELYGITDEERKIIEGIPEGAKSLR